ncbi:MAG: methyl-accepting chemotaxis protein [Elusimicrobiales bacterium]
MDTETTIRTGRSCKRHTIIIKKRLQVQYMAMLFMSVLLGFMIMAAEVVWNLSRMMAAHPALVQPLMDEITGAMPVLALKMAIYLGIVLIVASVVSHRMAGPVYKFEKIAALLAEGDLTRDIHLRKGDQLTELQDEFNKMAASLRAKVSGDRRRAQDAAQSLRALAEKCQDPQEKADMEKTASEVARITSEFTV